MKNVSIIIIVLLLASVSMLYSSNYANKVMYRKDIDKHNLVLTKLVALSCSSYFSSSYEGLDRYTEALIPGDLELLEVLIVDERGIIVGYRCKDKKTSKLGQKIEEEQLNKYKSLLSGKIEDKENKYTDYFSSVVIGGGFFGAVILRYDSESL